MTRQEKEGNPPSLVIPALLVVVLALSSSALLLCSFVIWLSEVIHSITLALLATGVALGVAAWLTYHISLSPALERLRKEYEMTMSIVALIRQGYDCVVQRVGMLLSLLKQ